MYDKNRVTANKLLLYTVIAMKPLTFSILRLLNNGEFHSGVTIAKELNVSRASVSNALKGLDTVGMNVHKIHGRGYRLPEPIQWLEKDTILKHLGQMANDFHLEILDTVNSTNSRLLKEASREKKLSVTTTRVIATELQTHGRGRQGRPWHSGLGNSLTFSLLWRFQQGASFLSGLSLAVGLAIIRTLKLAGIEDVMLKWPNDVMSRDRKLAGVLIELQGDMLGPTAVVIGIGLNLKLSDYVESQIDQAFTDLHAITSSVPERNQLLASLLTELVSVLKEFSHQGFLPFKKEWVHHHNLDNKPIILHLPDGSKQEGVVHGIADNGSLQLQTSLGRRCFGNGEIMLRQIL